MIHLVVLVLLSVLMCAPVALIITMGASACNEGIGRADFTHSREEAQIMPSPHLWQAWKRLHDPSFSTHPRLAIQIPIPDDGDEVPATPGSL
jgi:hypothetical protein